MITREGFANALPLHDYKTRRIINITVNIHYFDVLHLFDALNIQQKLLACIPDRAVNKATSSVRI